VVSPYGRSDIIKVNPYDRSTWIGIGVCTDTK
jgi:hypothetical protein